MGAPLEPAFTATLLLVTFALWLPMAPGLWFARRELCTRAVRDRDGFGCQANVGAQSFFAATSGLRSPTRL